MERRRKWLRFSYILGVVVISLGALALTQLGSFMLVGSIATVLERDTVATRGGIIFLTGVGLFFATLLLSRQRTLARILAITQVVLLCLVVSALIYLFGALVASTPARGAGVVAAAVSTLFAAVHLWWRSVRQRAGEGVSREGV